MSRVRVRDEYSSGQTRVGLRLELRRVHVRGEKGLG